MANKIQVRRGTASAWTSANTVLSEGEIGFENVPLICGVEMAVPGSLPLVLRVMFHVECNKSKNEIKHVYLRGASVLRKDLAQ